MQQKAQKSILKVDAIENGAKNLKIEVLITKDTNNHL